MAKFIKGDVVVLPFPLSDLSGSKRRLPFVITQLPGNDILLCQIISKASKDKYSIPITSIDFATGSLPVDSYIKPNKIFTADQNIIIRKAASVGKNISREAIDTMIKIISN